MWLPRKIEVKFSDNGLRLTAEGAAWFASTDYVKVQLVTTSCSPTRSCGDRFTVVWRDSELFTRLRTPHTGGNRASVTAYTPRQGAPAVYKRAPAPSDGVCANSTTFPTAPVPPSHSPDSGYEHAAGKGTF